MSESAANKRTLVCGLFVAGLAVLVCVAILWAIRTPGVDNDLTQVLTVARNIDKGDGVVTDTLYYIEHFQSGRIPAPQTVFPPGQPFVIAVLMRAGVEAVTAAMIVSVFGFVFIPIGVFFFCIRAKVSPDVAVVTSILWLCVVLTWANTLGRKSDIPFIALTMLSACWLVRADKKQVRDAVISGVFAAAALSFRYAGLFFMTAVGLTLVIEWLLKRTRLQFATLVAFCVPAGASAMLMFWRNYSIVGDIKGGNNYAVQKSLSEIARSMYRAISSLTGLDYARLPNGGVAEWTLVVVLIVGTIVFFRSSTKSAFQATARNLRENRTLLLCCVYSLVTVLMLYVLETKSQPGSRDRMYLAALPFAFCLIARALEFEPKPDDRRSRRLFGTCVVGAILVFLLGQANVADYRFGQFRHEQHWYRMKAAVDLPLGDSTARGFLSQRITREHPLLANEPQRVGELLRCPVVGLGSLLYTPKKWTPDEVLDLVRKYNIEYILVFTDSGSLEYEEIDFYRDVAAGTVPLWMELELENKALRIYRVK